MIKPETAQALTKGLLAGYGGETQFGTTNRGGFSLNQSHYEKDGITYHDEWLPTRTGGGQEIVEIDGQRFTRLYAGGALSEDALDKLGISKKDVINTLISQIKILGDKTRLDRNCLPDPTGDWQYSYTLNERDEMLDLITAKEQITYKQKTVFVHFFLLCPIA